MQVAQAMTRDVHLARPEQSIVEAAKMMAKRDCGILPIEENDRLVGMVTDRDIVVRALAQGKDGATRIRDIMSPEVKYCFEDEDIAEVARNMGDLQIRRLPVVNRDKRLVGILSLGDIATSPDKAECAEQALCGISEPASQHVATGHPPH